MLEGVKIQPLSVFRDERGEVRHILRSDSPLYKNFGEVYCSVVNPGFIKGWKKHSKQVQNFSVPVGNLKIVLYDSRPQSLTYKQIQEIYIGVDNYQLLQIPAGVWYAFQPVGKSHAMIVNCTDIPHDPKESMSLAIQTQEIPYQKWDL